jgi:predicted DsbA family dithiol-disulfide isomerase
VRSDIATAAKLQVRGTPNFWIGFRDKNDPNKAKVIRNLKGAKSYNEFKATFDELLEQGAK